MAKLRPLLLLVVLLLASGEARAVTRSARGVFLTEKATVIEALDAMVDRAKRNILVRIFVVSDNDGVMFTSPKDQPPMADRFADRLIRRKRANPELDVVVILDPINFVDYRQNQDMPWHRWAASLRSWGRIFEPLAKVFDKLVQVNRIYPERLERLEGKLTIRERLREAGITVLSSNLLENPKAHALYWERAGRDMAPAADDFRLKTLRRLHAEYPRIEDRLELEKKLTQHQVFSMTGDHRKFVIIDDGAMVWNASMNVWDNDFYSPDDGVVLSGDLAQDFVATFEATRRQSLELYRPLFERGALPELTGQFASAGYGYDPLESTETLDLPGGGQLALEPFEGRLLENGAIAAHLIERLQRLDPGSEVAIYQTLITDPEIIRAITDAARRQVTIRVLTDSYQNVYGEDFSLTHSMAFSAFRKAQRDGASLEVRTTVPDPRISEIHRKFTVIRGHVDGVPVDELVTGSANFSLHSRDGSQRELDVVITAGLMPQVARDYFERTWANQVETEQTEIPRLLGRWSAGDHVGRLIRVMMLAMGLGA